MTQCGLFDGTLPVVAGYAPDSDWSPPNLADLPSRLAGIVGIDLETRDDGLETRGPGWAFRDPRGYVVGYAIAADNWSGYLPIRHEGGGNLPADNVRRWLNDVLADETQPKVGSNSILYDLGWAERDGVTIRGTMYDVQWAEALLNEHRRTYRLDFLMRLYLNRAKNVGLLYDAARAFGLKNPGAELWRLPSAFVGPYGTEDAVGAREVFARQLPYLDAQGLRPLFELETELGPLYNDMRRTGIRVDVDRAERLRDRWIVERDEIVSEIHRRTGHRIDLWSSESMRKMLDDAGIPYDLTATTRVPSITKAWLARQTHWLGKAIRAARERDRLAGTFIDSALLSYAEDGRLHPEVHPLRMDFEKTRDHGVGGTVTGRLSMSNPNPQQFPARTEEGLELRRCIVPEDGERWGACDYSQQEPRLLVHFASLVRRNGEPLPGAIETRDRWRADPDLSFHRFVAEISGLDYFPAKTLNLARIYGRGIANTALELGRTRAEVKEMFAQHHRALPFAVAMSEICVNQLRRREPRGGDRYDRGRTHPPRAYLASILGRRSRFFFYEPDRFRREEVGRTEPFEARRERAESTLRELIDAGDLEYDVKHPTYAFPFYAAQRAYPGEPLKLAREHKGLNSLIQPSAADQTKKAMRDAYRAGLGPYLRIQVHDELDGSFPDERIARQLAECMRDAIPLEVPVKVDVKIGDTWGACK